MIAIVGDSFCANFNTKMISKHRHNQVHTDGQSWVTEMIKYTNGRIDIHGYGGQSWWYSWSKFQDCWDKKWHKLTAIIFCHTEVNRINTCSTIFEPDNNGNFLINKLQQQSIVSTFYKYLHDEKFQQFAQEQYAVMLREKFKDIKTLHFFTTTPLPNMITTLPGTVFTTPLTQIAIAGVNGSKYEIAQQINDMGEKRLANHLTPENNTALYRLIVKSLENYQPGITQIDMTTFRIRNTNYARWPDGAWGSDE